MPDEFCAVLPAYLKDWDPSASFQGDESLTDLGMDSINLVGLIVELETLFGFRFEESEMSPSTFSSPRSLWAVVWGHLTPGGVR